MGFAPPPGGCLFSFIAMEDAGCKEAWNCMVFMLL